MSFYMNYSKTAPLHFVRNIFYEGFKNAGMVILLLRTRGQETPSTCGIMLSQKKKKMRF